MKRQEQQGIEMKVIKKEKEADERKKENWGGMEKEVRKEDILDFFLSNMSSFLSSKEYQKNVW